MSPLGNRLLWAAWSILPALKRLALTPVQDLPTSRLLVGGRPAQAVERWAGGQINWRLQTAFVVVSAVLGAVLSAVVS